MLGQALGLALQQALGQPLETTQSKTERHYHWQLLAPLLLQQLLAEALQKLLLQSAPPPPWQQEQRWQALLQLQLQLLPEALQAL